MSHRPRTTSRRLAEAHEALWLELTALKTQVAAIAARRPAAAVPDAVRIAAESLIADAAPFARPRGETLPVAAFDYGGLAVQLGRMLARLDHWESRHTAWDAKAGCQAWQFSDGSAPVRRHRPTVPPPPKPERDMSEMRRKLIEREAQLTRRYYDAAFKAGREAAMAELAARESAAPQADEPTYPRVRRLE